MSARRHYPAHHRRPVGAWPGRACDECGAWYYRKSKRHWCSLACRLAALRKQTGPRFWGRVNKTETCWLWTGHSCDGRYGYFWFEGRGQRAHRVAWQITNGPIPPGLLVCHRCDVTKCVRPDHLFLGDVTANNRDAWAKGRARVGGYFKLSPEQVREVRMLGEQGLRQREIAQRFGVSRSVIGLILQGIVWRKLK